MSEIPLPYRTCRLTELKGCPGLWACHIPDRYCKCAYDREEKRTTEYVYTEGQLSGTEDVEHARCFVDGEVRILQRMGLERYLQTLRERPKRLKPCCIGQ